MNRIPIKYHIYLPKRILGQACGLLHKCILEDLLAVDLFFKRSTSDEAVNDNRLLLSNTIHSVYKKHMTVHIFFLGKFEPWSKSFILTIPSSVELYRYVRTPLCHCSRF